MGPHAQGLLSLPHHSKLGGEIIAAFEDMARKEEADGCGKEKTETRLRQRLG